ncbi:MAG TPA: spore gernimation protein, partial [Actinobacteria bacterium]|nr:spore gernimation protein [Actinomycetota bacterium]
LKETSVMTKAPDMGEFGDFSAKIDFQSSTKKGEIEIFEYSARDGSEVNKVIIPVNFQSD